MQVNKTRKHTNKKPNYSVKSKPINIDVLYDKLKHEIDQRVKYQGEHDKIWSYIKRTNNNRTDELDVVDKKIGTCTHNINKLISELCKYKKTHKAMRLANDYLSKEINRVDKIITYNATLVRDVDCGRTSLINSNGRTHTDTTNLKKYVSLKKEQKSKLVNWRKYILQYI